MAPSDPKPTTPATPNAPPKRKRSLRAVFAADIAGFSGRMSLNETSTVDLLGEIRVIGRRELDRYDGWLFGLPGDGLFATFESAINAVQCALEIQIAMAARPHLAEMPLRIGVHLGEVLLDDGIPYGETLNIASRLESLAEPGGILVSGTVMDAVSARLSATFEARGTPQLKNIPRRIPTFAVKPPPERSSSDVPLGQGSPLDQTAQFDRAALQGQVEPLPETAPGTQASSTAMPQPAVKPHPTDHLPLDQIARAAKDAAAAQERSLNDLLGEASDPLEEPSVRQPTPTVDQNAASRVNPDDAGLPAEFIEQITKALAEYIGPFAKMIVDKHIGKNRPAFELISELEQHIPTEEERVAFRLRASQINRSPD